MLPPVAMLFDPKHILRERMKAERRAAARVDARLHAARVFMDAVPIPAGAVIALYHPIKDELGTGPLAAALVERGAVLALPVVAAKSAPLIFRRYAPGDALIDGAYGVKIPGEDAEVIVPSIIVTPLLAFTRKGARLGYGGGFYDRTLANLRKTGAVLAIGYAYGAQEVDALPLTPLDQSLDWIVTEREAFKI